MRVLASHGADRLVKLAFAKKSLRTLCEKEATGVRVLGDRVARKLRARLADLDAAESMKDLVAGRPQELDILGQVRLQVTPEVALILTANHELIPTLSNGKVDWGKVTRVKIIRVEGIDE